MANKLSFNYFLKAALLFICYSGFSQQSNFIVTKDGKKINLDGATVEVISGNQFQYKLAGSDKKNKISLSEIKQAILPNFRIEIFTFDGKPKSCFVIAELEGKKLVGYSEIVTSTALTGTNEIKERTSTRYRYYILNHENKILDTLDFLDTYGKKYVALRDEAEAILRKHFSECPEIIGRLNENDFKNKDLSNAGKMVKDAANRSDENNAKVFLLFQNPKYSACSEESSIKIDAAGPVIIENQNYNLGALSLDDGGVKKEWPLKGTFSVADGHVIIATKQVTSKYKIISTEAGVMHCEDKDMLHKVTIQQEKGKVKGFDYDTKIVFIVDKKMGGATAYYWSKKI